MDSQSRLEGGFRISILFFLFLRSFGLAAEVTAPPRPGWHEGLSSEEIKEVYRKRKEERESGIGYQLGKSWKSFIGPIDGYLASKIDGSRNDDNGSRNDDRRKRTEKGSPRHSIFITDEYNRESVVASVFTCIALGYSRKYASEPYLSEVEELIERKLSSKNIKKKGQLMEDAYLWIELRESEGYFDARRHWIKKCKKPLERLRDYLM